MAKVCLMLVWRRAADTARPYHMKDIPNPEFYDLHLLVATGRKHLQRSELTDDQRKLIEEVVRGSENILNGKQPYDE
jgi:hypothetical protein